MRFSGAFMLGAALVMTIASCGPNRQPPPDPAAMRQTRWPTCINALMKERMNHCPDPKASLAAGPGACTPTASTVAAAPQSITLTSLAPPAEVLQGDADLAKAEAPLSAKNLALADRRYQALAKSTADGTAARVWAHLGLVRTSTLLGKPDEALRHAIVARKLAKKNSVARTATPTGTTRRAIILTYANAGTLTSAYENFRDLSNDAASEDADTVRMLGELATELTAQGKLGDAAKVVATARDVDPTQACMHSARLTHLSVALADRKATAAALSTLVADMQALDDGAPIRKRCRKETANVLVTLADTWRNEGTKTLDEETLDYAAQAHNVLLTNYEQQELDKLGVCIDRRVVAHRYANLLFVQKSWNKCGPAYEAALREDPRGARGERAALAAVTCRQRAWLHDGARLELADDHEKMQSSIQRTDDWLMMLSSFHRYVCVARDDAARAEPVSKAAFARAEAFYEGGALWESAVAFRLLAFSPESTLASRHAAKRYAVIMDDLAADDVCQIELQLDLEQLDRVHCQGKRDDETCGAIHSILDRIRRHIL